MLHLEVISTLSNIHNLVLTFEVRTLEVDAVARLRTCWWSYKLNASVLSIFVSCLRVILL